MERRGESTVNYLRDALQRLWGQTRRRLLSAGRASSPGGGRGPYGASLRRRLRALKRPDRQALLLFVYTLTLFAFFLVLTFPHDAALKYVEAELRRGAPLRWSYEPGGFSVRRGYELRDVRVSLVGRDGPGLGFDRLQIRPRLLGLVLGGQPFPVRLRGETHGGRLEAEVSWREAEVRGSITLSGLDLGRLAPGAALEAARLSGTLSAEARFSGEPGAPETRRGEINANVADGGLEGTLGGLTLPGLRFEGIHLAGELEGRRLVVRELTARAEGLEVNGEGQVLLGSPLPKSRLQLRCSLTAGSGLSPSLRLLLSLLAAEPGSAGSRTLRISGTLEHPKLH